MSVYYPLIQLARELVERLAATCADHPPHCLCDPCATTHDAYHTLELIQRLAVPADQVVRTRIICDGCEDPYDREHLNPSSYSYHPGPY